MKVKERLRFIHSKIKVDEETGCWNWLGAETPQGYAHVWSKSGGELVHRLMYQWFVGPIPAKNHVHHKCNNQGCINPAHLESLTVSKHRATIQDGNQNINKTQCKHGHEFTPENTYVVKISKNRVHRQCKQCRLRHTRRQQEKKKCQEKS